MNYFIKRSVFLVTALAVVLTVVGNALPTSAAGRLVKSADSSTVYYVDDQNIRHPFSTRATYESWYGADFGAVQTLDSATLAEMPLGQNITIRPGKLVKVPSQPQVYAIEQGGLLRPLKNATIAQGIYGAEWTKRVIDIPEVFFQDYTIGSVLEKTNAIPDDVLYYLTDTDTYYYKRQGALQPFANLKAIGDNKLSIQEAIVSRQLFAIRSTAITGLSPQVFNPVAPLVAHRGDCRNTDLRVGVIYLSQGAPSSGTKEKITKAMQGLPESFKKATNNLSSLSVDAVAATPLTPGVFTEHTDGTIEVSNEAINLFYDTHHDDYDFLFVWTDFPLPNNDTDELAYFIPVSNWQTGNGRGLLDRAGVYGSAGRLKGIIMMGDHQRFAVDTADTFNIMQEVLLHEILHQWSAYLLAPGIGSEQILLREPDQSHWNLYVNFISPLGGAGWVKTGANTFSSRLTTATKPRAYSQLDLYAMGLVPIQFLQPVSAILLTQPQTQEDTIVGRELVITPELITTSNGPLVCQAPKR